ncbi:hypothetical protein ACFQPF_13080 [Fictibacillus iocasae]|uniref:Uncharacterized protein n=1 Tax=Fictibacillus iocasae TaxID=2715437 RepID=A0ABW2NQ67_9BACL
MNKNSVSSATLIDSFKGVTDNTFIPPDTNGAIDQTYVVNAVNGKVQVNSRATNDQLYSATLNEFWSPTGMIQPGTVNAFDPKILYDASTNRFFMVSIAGSTAPNYLLLAASEPGNPFTWTYHAIDASVTEENGRGDLWADYPNISFNTEFLYVTANMFISGDGFDGVKVWVFNKSDLYDLISSYVYFYNPDSIGFTTVPAQVYSEETTNQYLVSADFPNAISLYRIFFDSGEHFWKVLPSVRVDRFQDPPNASQKDSTQGIDTGDGRLLQAVYRNRSIWTTHAVASDDGRRAEAAWYQIDPVSSTVIQQGRIRDGSRSFYYPSLAVNAENHVVVGFSGSSPNEYASAFYTSRLGTDPAGFTQPVALMRQGQASYFKTYSGTRNRWGDYSATMIDPADDSVFWTVQEYAVRENTWETWWGVIRLS